MRKTFVFKLPPEVKFNHANELTNFFGLSQVWFRNDNNNGTLIEFWKLFANTDNYVYDKENNRISLVIDKNDSLISYENAKNICFILSLHYNSFQYSGSVDVKNDKNYYFIEFDGNNKKPVVQGFENEEEFNKWDNTNSDTIVAVKSEEIISGVVDQTKDELQKEFLVKKNEEEFNEFYDPIVIRFKKPTVKQNNNQGNYRCGIILDYVSRYSSLNYEFDDTNYKDITLSKKDCKGAKLKFRIMGNDEFGIESESISIKKLIKEFDVYKYKPDIIVTVESGEICIQSAGKVREQLQEKLQTKDELQKKLQTKIKMIKKIITALIVLSIILVAVMFVTLGLFTGGVAPAILTPLIAKCLIGVLGGIGVLGFFASWFAHRKEKSLKKSINPLQDEISTLQNEIDDLKRGIDDLGEKDSELNDNEKNNNGFEIPKSEGENGKDNENEYGS